MSSVKNTSLKITQKISDDLLLVYEVVARVANEESINYLVIGAAARDIVMHHIYGADVQRATRDVDFGVMVRDWDSYKVVVTRLRELGFTNEREQQRLRSDAGVIVDLVPFGDISNTRQEINWPPDGAITMSVLGFQEVCDHALSVCLRSHPKLDVPFASVEGFVLLKLIAWTERDARIRVKDALDISYSINNYSHVSGVVDECFELQNTMESYDHDIDRAVADLLGRRVRDLANDDTLRYLLSKYQDETIREKLTIDMVTSRSGNAEIEINLVSAFFNGLQGD